MIRCNLFFLVLLLSCTISQVSYSQDPRIAIAILPFAKSSVSTVSNPEAYQETVTKEFVERNRFQIVDRSKFEKVLQELKIQTRVVVP